jgi:Tfp pilus assembly protein PilO
MNARRIDQIWLFGGLSLILIIITSGWLMLIKPQKDEAASQREQAATFSSQVSSVQSKFTAQQKEAKKLDTYMATLATYQAALPVSSNDNDIPSFLRELQALGTRLQVDVSGYSAAEPEASTAAPTVKELPITLNASGKVANLSNFLRQLQNVQPRAVLIETATLNNGANGESTVSLSLKAFITTSETLDLDELKKSLTADE